MRGKVAAHLIENSRTVAFFASFVVIGSVALLITRAATPSVGVEAELGNIQGNASRVINDASSSGGGYVRFAANPTGYRRLGASDYIVGATATQDQVNGEYIPGLAQSTSLVNQHISNFGVSPKNVISSLIINPDGTYALSLDFTLSLDKRFGASGILKDFNNQNVVLTACCNFDNDGRQLMNDEDFDGSTSDEDLNETPPRWVNDPDSDDPNEQDYTSQPTYDRQIYYKIYAEIVKRVVQRYQNIKYVQVWNEMKGFYEGDFTDANGVFHPGFKPVPGKSHVGGENYKKYTVFYNHVYSAVKEVSRPDGSKVQVGGPYVVMRSYKDDNPNATNWTEPGIQSPGGVWGYVSQEHLEAVKYWNSNKVGADFITLDIKNHNRCGNPNTSDCEAEVNDDPYVRMDKYGAVADWVRGNISSSMPIWWAEWYARKNPIVQDAAPESCWHVNATISVTSTIDPTTGKTIWNCSAGPTANKAYQGTIPERVAIMSTGLIRVVKTGVRTALIWGTKSHLSDGKYHPLALYKDSMEETGVNVTQRCIKNHFESGAVLYDPQNTNGNIEVLATDGPGGKWLLMVNKTATPQTTSAYGTSFSFAGYEVKCVQP